MLEFLLPYLFLLYFSEVLCLLTGTNIWILSTYDPLGDIRGRPVNYQYTSTSDTNS